IYVMIYSFHMPLFVFVSGYFSKNLEKVTKNALKTGLIYLFIHIFIDIITVNPVPLLTPYWLDWYLLSLFLWRITIKLLHKVKFIIPISFAAALISGFIPQIGRNLSLSRTFVLFPFFLIGFFFNKEKIIYIKERLSRSKWFFLLSAIISIILFFKNLPIQILYFADNYYSVGTSFPVAFFARFFIIGTAVVMCFCILSIIPEHKYSFTYLGENSLYIFLLHALLVKFVDFIPKNNWWNLTLYIIISGIIIYLLGNRISVMIIQKARNKTISWIKNY
ncbi:MAG: hypothetical protein K0S55_455, partial [Clostridia bacterium]|nr:hypothetical protein [Clostridia bacterium]